MGLLCEIVMYLCFANRCTGVIEDVTAECGLS